MPACQAHRPRKCAPSRRSRAAGARWSRCAAPCAASMDYTWAARSRICAARPTLKMRDAQTGPAFGGWCHTDLTSSHARVVSPWGQSSACLGLQARRGRTRSPPSAARPPHARCALSRLESVARRAWLAVGLVAIFAYCLCFCAAVRTTQRKMFRDYARSKTLLRPGKPTLSSTSHLAFICTSSGAPETDAAYGLHHLVRQGHAGVLGGCGHSAACKRAQSTMSQHGERTGTPTSLS